MNAVSRPNVTPCKRISLWLISVAFVLFQFFLQLSSGVVIGAIVHDIHLSAFEVGILASAFYYVYTSMQIPVGMLFDHRSTRKLLAFSALLCAFGCFFFAQSQGLLFLIIGRLLIGGGSSFAFVGLSHILREYFPIKKFAFMIGLSETLGFLITVLGIISMGSLIEELGWRSFINGAGIIGLFIALLCWLFIPDNNHKVNVLNHESSLLLSILKNSKAWLNGIYVGLSFSVITVFAAMWAVPFLQIKLNCSLKEASILDAMIFLGAAVSCPFFGKLAILFERRQPLMISSCLGTALLFIITLFLPLKSHLLMGFLMFMIGLSCGAYMLAYTISNEIAPENALSTCTGFTNTLAMLSAPLMQPLVGYLFDFFNQGSHGHDQQSIQKALMIIPISLVISSILVLKLPEKSHALDKHLK